MWVKIFPNSYSFPPPPLILFSKIFTYYVNVKFIVTSTSDFLWYTVLWNLRIRGSMSTVWPAFVAMCMTFCISNTNFLNFFCVLGFWKGNIHFFPKVLKKSSSCQKNGYHFLTEPKVINITFFFEPFPYWEGGSLCSYFHISG